MTFGYQKLAALKEKDNLHSFYSDLLEFQSYCMHGLMIASPIETAVWLCSGMASTVIFKITFLALFLEP